MNSDYDVKEWAAGTTRGRRVFNFGFRLSGSEFRGWKLLKTVTMQETRGVTERAYLWQNKRDPEHAMVKVNVTERNSWRLAQASLRERLLEHARPDIPRGTKRVAQVGDVVFAARYPESDIPAEITFVRGNVCVSVSTAGPRRVDVADMALRLDRALSEPPAKREIEKRKVRPRSPRATAVKAKRSVALIEDLREAASRGEWVKVIVPDGELVRKGNALIYKSPESGKKRVTAYTVQCT
jgi:hypothetical protein